MLDGKSPFWGFFGRNRAIYREIAIYKSFKIAQNHAILLENFRFKQLNNLGRYLWGRTNNAGDAYFGQISIPSIDLGEPGTYEMTFHVVMFCDGANCIIAGDSIKIIINEEEENIVETIDYNNIANQRRWVKRSFKFSIQSPTIDVIVNYFKNSNFISLQ